jgi:hypothetical protein
MSAPSSAACRPTGCRPIGVGTGMAIAGSVPGMVAGDCGAGCGWVTGDPPTPPWLNDRTAGRDPLDSVEEAALVLAFVMHWRFHVVSTSGLTLQANFLTRETFLDIVTSCHGCILRFPQFRDNWGGKFKPDGPLFSSAYSEYFFQYGGMAQTNSPVVSVLGWWRHLKHYLYQQFAEAE